MKIIDKIRAYIEEHNLNRRGLLKYVVVVLVFLVLLLLRENGNPFQYVRNAVRIHQLNQSIDNYNQSSQKTKQQIRELNSTRDKMEKYAREQYLMHEDDEDIYLTDDDSLR